MSEEPNNNESSNKDKGEPITIRVVDQEGDETQFKIKRTTKMGKVKEAYAQRKGVQASSIRFLVDGDAVNDEQTPKMLELDDGEQIDCMLQQVGGYGGSGGSGSGGYSTAADEMQQTSD